MFAPLFESHYNINIYSRKSEGKSLRDVLEQFLQPEIWPISLEDLPANLSFIDIFIINRVQNKVKPTQI